MAKEITNESVRRAKEDAKILNALTKETFLSCNLVVNFIKEVGNEKALNDEVMNNFINNLIKENKEEISPKVIGELEIFWRFLEVTGTTNGRPDLILPTIKEVLGSDELKAQFINRGDNTWLAPVYNLLEVESEGNKIPQFRKEKKEKIKETLAILADAPTGATITKEEKEALLKDAFDIIEEYESIVTLNSFFGGLKSELKIVSDTYWNELLSEINKMYLDSKVKILGVTNIKNTAKKSIEDSSYAGCVGNAVGCCF